MASHFLSRTTLLALLTLLSFNHGAFAKTLGDYLLVIKGADQPVLRGLSDPKAGWSCFPTADVTYAESMLDHLGQMRPVKQIASGKWNWFARSNEPNTVIKFQRNFAATNPVADVSVYYYCERNLEGFNPCAFQKLDPKTNLPTCEYGYVKGKQSTFVNWKCKIDALPDSPANKVNAECAPQTNYPLAQVKESSPGRLELKPVKVALKLEKLHEITVATNCKTNDRDNIYTIELSQGVGGHFAEDDFEFNIVIDGVPHTIPTPSGLLLSDIRYCAKPGQEVADLQISAVERDMKWDDHYTADPVTLPLQDGLSVMVRLTRKSEYPWLVKSIESELKLTVHAPKKKGI